MLIPLTKEDRFKKVPGGVFFLLAANLGFFLFMTALGYNQAALIQQVGTVPQRFLQAINHPAEFPGEMLFMVLALFLHANWLHLLGNMIFLWAFGVEMEERLGTGRFLLLYAACGIFAQLLYVAFEPGAKLPLIGASGAVSGLLGGFLALDFKGKIRMFLYMIFDWKIIYVPAWLFFIIWIFLQLIIVFAPGIFSFAGADAAALPVHLGGFVTGFFICRLFKKREPKNDKRRMIDDEEVFRD
ncbi:MAG: rhomboid family intramembrane serine protease [Chloroflexi bacterium]|nr:rhomboid family intramembrane serine protease [Chloroflexota bacterium]